MTHCAFVASSFALASSDGGDDTHDIFVVVCDHIPIYTRVVVVASASLLPLWICGSTARNAEATRLEESVDCANGNLEHSVVMMYDDSQQFIAHDAVNVHRKYLYINTKIEIST